MNGFGLGFFCGIASVATCWYLTKLVFGWWLGPMLDKYDRGHE